MIIRNHIFREPEYKELRQEIERNDPNYVPYQDFEPEKEKSLKKRTTVDAKNTHYINSLKEMEKEGSVNG